MNRTWMRALGAMMALALSACGSNKGGSSSMGTTGSGPTGAPGGGDDGGGVPARCGQVAVEILAAQQEAVSALGLVLGQVLVSRGGIALPVMDAPLGTPLDLSLGPVVGRFVLAEGEAPVSVSFCFAGGTATRGGLVAELGVCTGPIAFNFSPERLNPAWCRARVVLQVDRSVVPDDGGLALVPQYKVFF